MNEPWPYLFPSPFLCYDPVFIFSSTRHIKICLLNSFVWSFQKRQQSNVTCKFFLFSIKGTCSSNLPSKYTSSACVWNGKLFRVDSFIFIWHPPPFLMSDFLRLCREGVTERGGGFKKGISLESLCSLKRTKSNPL